MQCALHAMRSDYQDMKWPSIPGRPYCSPVKGLRCVRGSIALIPVLPPVVGRLHVVVRAERDCAMGRASKAAAVQRRYSCERLCLRLSMCNPCTWTFVVSPALGHPRRQAFTQTILKTAMEPGVGRRCTFGPRMPNPPCGPRSSGSGRLLATEQLLIIKAVRGFWRPAAKGAS